MRLIYKHINSTFLISTDLIKNKNLRTKLNSVLENEFKGFLLSNHESSNSISFYFTDNLNPFLTEDSYLCSDSVYRSENQIYYKDAEFDVLINLQDSFKIILKINPEKLAKYSVRILHKAYKNNLERIVSTFYYRVFLLFTQIWNIKHNYTYMHAAAFSHNNFGTIISADSGVGKSALLLRLSQEDNFDFISDDLSIIGLESSVSFMGRFLSVKPYHLTYFSFLKSFIKYRMPIMQKMQWQILKDQRLIFRVNPNDLFHNIKEEVTIKQLIHLSNHTRDNFEIKELSIENFLDVSLAILNNEFFLSFKRLNDIASISGTSFSSSYQLMHKVKDIYHAVFSELPRKLVLVPYKSNPNDLYDFLIKEGCLK